MRRILIPVLLTTLGFASAAYGAAAPAAAVAADMFTIADMKVEATALSPRAARDLAMLQGRPLAWSKLFRRFTVQDAWGSEPQLTDGQLQGLILSVDVDNERRNTTRYLADVMYHFNPAAVRALLRKSNIAFADSLSEGVLAVPDEQVAPALVGDGTRTHLTASVQFATLGDWAALRARLGAVKTVTGMDVVGLTLNEAEIDLTYSGHMEQLRDALAQQSLALSNNGDEYTLELDTAVAAK
jgi:hypothetical protein